MITSKEIHKQARKKAIVAIKQIEEHIRELNDDENDFSRLEANIVQACRKLIELGDSFNGEEDFANGGRMAIYEIIFMNCHMLSMLANGDINGMYLFCSMAEAYQIKYFNINKGIEAKNN